MIYIVVIAAISGSYANTVELALNGHWFERPLEAYGQFFTYFIISPVILWPTLWNAVNGQCFELF